MVTNGIYKDTNALIAVSKLSVGNAVRLLRIQYYNTGNVIETSLYVLVANIPFGISKSLGNFIFYNILQNSSKEWIFIDVTFGKSIMVIPFAGITTVSPLITGR